MLTKAQQEALYAYLIDGGYVGEHEFVEVVTQYQYRIKTVSTIEGIKLLQRWHKDAAVDYTFNINKCYYSYDEKRVQHIAQLHKQGSLVWPYVVSRGVNFRQLVANDIHHGDGYHRLVLAIRQNRSLEFLFHD